MAIAKKNDAVNEQLKKKLVDAYNFCKKNAGEIANSSIELQIGSVLNKYFNGAEITNPVRERSAAEVKKQSSRVITHKGRDAVKKKEDTELPARHAGSKELKAMTLSQLKVIAHRAGLDIKEKDADELIAIIEWHQKGEAESKMAMHKEAAKKRRLQREAAKAAGRTLEFDVTNEEIIIDADDEPDDYPRDGLQEGDIVEATVRLEDLIGEEE